MNRLAADCPFQRKYFLIIPLNFYHTQVLLLASIMSPLYLGIKVFRGSPQFDDVAESYTIPLAVVVDLGPLTGLSVTYPNLLQPTTFPAQGFTKAVFQQKSISAGPAVVFILI